VLGAPWDERVERQAVQDARRKLLAVRGRTRAVIEAAFRAMAADDFWGPKLTTLAELDRKWGAFVPRETVKQPLLTAVSGGMGGISGEELAKRRAAALARRVGVPQ
jgi:hypothetical protein